jgi:hypothetical protein
VLLLLLCVSITTRSYNLTVTLVLLCVYASLAYDSPPKATTAGKQHVRASGATSAGPSKVPPVKLKGKQASAAADPKSRPTTAVAVQNGVNQSTSTSRITHVRTLPTADLPLCSLLQARVLLHVRACGSRGW